VDQHEISKLIIIFFHFIFLVAMKLNYFTLHFDVKKGLKIRRIRKILWPDASWRLLMKREESGSGSRTTRAESSSRMGAPPVPVTSIGSHSQRETQGRPHGPDCRRHRTQYFWHSLSCSTAVPQAFELEKNNRIRKHVIKVKISNRYHITPIRQLTLTPLPGIKVVCTVSEALVIIVVDQNPERIHFHSIYGS